jgi:hypothetical protein
METVADFIAGLSDKEFSFFVRFRASEFMRESKRVIAEELVRRNLTLETMNAFIQNQPVLVNENCPRCQGHNFFLERDRTLIATKYGSGEVDVFSNRCRICGYNPSRDRPLNFRVRLKKWLGSYSWKVPVPKGM